MHQIPDDYLADVMPIAKKIASAGGFSQYNVLQVLPCFFYEYFTSGDLIFICRTMARLPIKQFLMFTSM